MTEFMFAHMPFAAVLGISAMVGYTLPKRLLTVERARAGNGRRSGFYHWLRELLPLIVSVLAGCVGLFWVDPEGQGWSRAMSVAYFTCAGVAALPAVSVARGMGYKIELPDSSAKD